MAPRSAPSVAAAIMRQRGAIAAALLVVGAIVAVHHRVYTIPFMYSEIAGIERNPVVKSPALFVDRMLTPRGLLQRPLSVLSYTIDHALYGNAVAGYHVTNVVIHCVNVLLVMAIARQSFAAPLVAGLVFALHPLATACVSQIFGRNYSLATTFFLAAVGLYVRWRRHGPLRALPIATIGILFMLTVLTKQSLVVLPLVLAWYELALAGRTPRVSLILVAAAVASIALGIVLVVLYALPLSRTAPVSPVQFFLSQLGNALTTVRFFVLPYRTALIHDLPVYREAWHPDVLVGAFMLAALVAIAWRGRARPSGWLLGAMLICLVPSNTFLPKNEIVREWRLYPSLAFFALLVGELFAAIAARLRRRVLVGALYAGLALYLATFVRADLRQNVAYQSGMSAWRQVLDRYPHWADAMNNVAFYHYWSGDYRGARHYFAGAVRAAPEVFLYRQNLARAYAALGDRERAHRHATRATEILARYGRRTMALQYR